MTKKYNIQISEEQLEIIEFAMLLRFRDICKDFGSSSQSPDSVCEQIAEVKDVYQIFNELVYPKVDKS